MSRISPQTRLEDAYSAAIEEVVGAIRKQPEAALSLGDMADMAALSPSHFCRVFHTLVGVPPVEFQSALRLDLAKRLLLTTPLSVTEICFAVGYGSPGTFTARFSRLVGMAPRMLREQARQGTAAGPVSPRKPSLRGAGADLVGTLHGPDGFCGMIFVALFPRPIPQGQPVACAILSEPGPFRIAGVPDGRWFLLAAAQGESAGEENALALSGVPLVGVGDGPVLVRHRRVSGTPNIQLRPPRPLDPPVLIALPPARVSAA